MKFQSSCIVHLYTFLISFPPAVTNPKNILHAFDHEAKTDQQRTQNWSIQRFLPLFYSQKKVSCEILLLEMFALIGSNVVSFQTISSLENMIFCSTCIKDINVFSQAFPTT